MAHRVRYTTRQGWTCVDRVFGCSDRDSAAAVVIDLFPGCTITEAEFVEDDAPRIWGEGNIHVGQI